MAPGPERSPARFDLVVRGGEVLDPGGPRSGRLDVGVAAGQVAAVEPELPRGQALRELDARGALVLPGLVDLHTHLLAGDTFWGIDPSSLAWRSGVTTWVDAGSAGADRSAELRRRAMELRPLRVRALLNISRAGLREETGECRDPDLLDTEACAEVARAHRDLVVGVKCRLDRNSTGGTGLLALERALAAAALAELPLMVHIGAGPPSIDEVLDRLRPGDLVTHCATGQSMSLVGADGELRPSARRARGRGVLLDVGHGWGGFSFAVAEALLRAGAPPDVISSDAHQRSVAGPMFDLPTCLAKYLALGLPLEEVVRAATSGPAAVLSLGPALGTLAPGAPADLAVFELQQLETPLYDVYLVPRSGGQLLVNRFTICAGELLDPVPAPEPMPWIELTPEQRALFAGDPADRRPWVLRLPGPEGLPRPELEGPLLGC